MIFVSTGNNVLDSQLRDWLAGGSERDVARLEEDGLFTCVLIAPRICYRVAGRSSWEDAVRNALTIAFHAERRPDPLPGAAALAALQALALSRGVRS